VKIYDLTSVCDGVICFDALAFYVQRQWILAKSDSDKFPWANISHRDMKNMTVKQQPIHVLLLLLVFTLTCKVSKRQK